MGLAGLALAVLDFFRRLQCGLVIPRQIHGGHITVGRLAQKPLLWRQPHAGLGDRIIKPHVVAVLEHELAGITRRQYKSDETGELPTHLLGARVTDQRARIDLLASLKLGQSHGHAERLSRVADGVSRRKQFIRRRSRNRQTRQ